VYIVYNRSNEKFSPGLLWSSSQFTCIMFHMIVTIDGYTIIPRKGVISGYEVFSVKEFVAMCDNEILDSEKYIIILKKRMLAAKQEYPYDINGVMAEWCGLIISDREKSISRYSYLKSVAKGKVNIKKDALFNIEKAKSVPLESIIEFNRGHKRLCIWHNEKTPSLTLNKKHNFMYCFGCNKFGSSIDAIMHLYGLTFREAVIFLNEDLK